MQLGSKTNKRPRFPNSDAGPISSPRAPVKKTKHGQTRCGGTRLSGPRRRQLTVFGGLLVFSKSYRKRAAAKRIEPYFPSHPERDQYVTLLQKTDPPANDTLLKAALVRRAMTDVQRILRLREDKPALQLLLQKGSIGDDTWNSLLAAEKELEAELVEVAAEANSFVEGWGQLIFQTAGEILQNEKIRALMEANAKARAEKELRYGIKSKSLIIPQVPNVVVSTGPLPPPISSTPSTSSTKSSGSGTLSPTSKSATLSPSSSAGVLSGGSDGESSRPGSPTTSRSSQKKKSKKRK